MRSFELPSGLVWANWGLLGPIGAYSLQLNSGATSLGQVEPWPPMGKFGIPTVTRQKCRDSGAAGVRGGESRQRFSHFGGTNERDAGLEVNSARTAGSDCPLPGHFSGHIVRLGELRKSRHESRHGVVIQRFHAKEGATVAEPATA